MIDIYTFIWMIIKNLMVIATLGCIGVMGIVTVANYNTWYKKS